MKYRSLILLLLCLIHLSCDHKNRVKIDILCKVTVNAQHRSPIDPSELGMGAMDYSKLEGILVEMIPQHHPLTANARTHMVIFDSERNSPEYLCMRPGDTVILVNKSHRPIVLDCYDGALAGFPVRLGVGDEGKAFSAKLPITKTCRHAVIFDRSGNYTLTLTNNNNHKAYVRSGQEHIFGTDPRNPLTEGQWTLKLSHPRLLTQSETLVFDKIETKTKTIPYKLPALNKGGQVHASFPKVP